MLPSLVLLLESYGVVAFAIGASCILLVIITAIVRHLPPAEDDLDDRYGPVTEAERKQWKQEDAIAREREEMLTAYWHANGEYTDRQGNRRSVYKNH